MDKAAELNAQEAENKALIALRFDGKALVYFDAEKKIFSDIHYKDKDYYKLIHVLNEYSDEISEEIVYELNKNFKDLVLDVSASIEFKKGSVLWEGMITCADILGKIDGAYGGIKLVIAAATLVINKVIRRRIENVDRVIVKKIDSNVVEKKVIEKSVNDIATGFLWWCAGAVSDIIQKYPEDKSKYQTIGAAVFSTALLAFCSGGYAFYAIFMASNYSVILGVIFGLIWGLIIFNIDRSIVSSMRKCDNETIGPVKRFFFGIRLALPRMVLAVILGYVISKPIELKIFENKIKVKVNEHKQEVADGYILKLRNGKYLERIRSINNNLKELEGSVSRAHDNLKTYTSLFNEEMDANGGTGRYGYGDVAKKKERDKIRAEDELKNKEGLLDSFRKNADSALSRIEDELKQERKRYEEKFVDDFSERLGAFNELKAKDGGIEQTNNGIILLLVVIELLPIMIKILSSIGPYDTDLNAREKMISEKIKHDLFIANIKNHYEQAAALQEKDRNVRELKAENEVIENIGKYRRELLVITENEFLNYVFDQTRKVRVKEVDGIIRSWEYDSKSDIFKPFNGLYAFFVDHLGINNK
jgi:hypothetical protein